MIGTEKQPSDIRALLGMNTPAAGAILAFYLAGVAAPAVIGVHSTGGHYWQSAVTVVVYWCVGVALLTIRRDPLPITSSMLICLAAPVMTALVVLTPPWSDYVHAIWPANVYIVMQTFLCVRGRTGFALSSIGLTFAVIAVWSTITGQGGPLPGILLALPNLGPLAMSTMFAYTIRPAAAKIFAAKAEQDAALRQIEKAAENRRALDDRLHALAAAARPLVERVGTDTGFDPAHIRACEALESQLSAILRGSGLVDDIVNPSADAARNRGVAVKMFDDGDLNMLDDEVRARLLRGIAVELDRAENGEIVIRTVPAGRAELATVRAQGSGFVRRATFGLEGELLRESVRDSL
ncbi:hypothetical protein [Nocardia bovistercoris]|uniref:Uncharacterized protein n=1 Tax=Nocardia bovistercoris TaxID=2785916 RepID=A0A931IHR6_9NOCA|nr:hypothetical protein [Nocardia bovistercoris]MBH0779853.1 hypothetical protein [Nocardia bovistercoris]